jgi:excisionase family DNA binding protein
VSDCDYFSVTAVAAKLVVKPDTVLDWIHRGELRAINVARKTGGRPRWRIEAEALDQFLAARTASPNRPVTRPRRRRLDNVTQYF